MFNKSSINNYSMTRNLKMSHFNPSTNKERSMIVDRNLTKSTESIHVVNAKFRNVKKRQK